MMYRSIAPRPSVITLSCASPSMPSRLEAPVATPFGKRSGTGGARGDGSGRQRANSGGDSKPIAKDEPMGAVGGGSIGVVAPTVSPVAVELNAGSKRPSPAL